ncbi:neural proliferation differentiation and control protein 1 [Vombatus ursinus]|uniref:neural proliferation differentiation and control protein 1 n=1 Tax=Vombatus ursinus TaxID=29139 RepID=UPI000FFD50C1|nr:neural proliferation differentiation and control protein 1 [Vombatus ursinus]
MAYPTLWFLLFGIILNGALRSATAIQPDAACPRSLDCTLRRRALCPPGSGACGPCLRPFVEDDLGRCIPKKQLPRGTWDLGRRVLQKEIRLAQKTDYSSKSQKVSGSPAFGRSMPGDKKLAQSAQMYHYQHQKQQMLSLEKHKEQPKIMDSGSSEEENEDGDFTVYECPGLAPMNALTGEMEVKNPMFDDSALVGPSPHSASSPPATAGSLSGSGPRVSSGSRTSGSRTGARPSPRPSRLVAPKSHQ